MKATQATMKTIATVQAEGPVVQFKAEEGVPTLKLRLRPEPSLKDLCHEHIKDSFYYGIYGDTSSPDMCFRLVIDKKTGFFNATKMCQDGGKRFRDWSRLAKSQEMIEYYENSFRADLRGSSGPTYEILGDRATEKGSVISGTFVCKDLILAIAQWISIPFYHKCSEIVNDFFIPKNQELTKDPEEYQEVLKQLDAKTKECENQAEELKEKTNEIEELKKMMKKMMEDTKHQNEELLDTTREIVHQNNGLKVQVTDLKDKVITVQKKLKIAVVDRAPQPDKTIKKERFVMMKRPGEEYPYYVVRGQTAYTASVKLKRRTMPTSPSLLTLSTTPTARPFTTGSEMHFELRVLKPLAMPFVSTTVI